MRVLCVQSHRQDRDSAPEYVNSLMNEVRDLDFDLMVLPEKWISSEFSQDDSELDDLISGFTEISKTKDCAVVPGSFSIKRGSFLYNTSPVISRGRILGYQDKIALFKNENGRYESGGNIRTFDIGGISLSVAVCYDLDFPFYAKIAVEKGAEVLVNPSLITEEFREMWYLYVKGRSLENRLPVISVNSASEMFGGGSIVTGMRPHNGGIILESSFMKDEHLGIIETNVEEVKPYIIARKREDPGFYGFHEKNDSG